MLTTAKPATIPAGKPASLVIELSPNLPPLGTNVRSPKNTETLEDWLQSVVEVREVKHSAACEGGDKYWSEAEFAPEGETFGDNLVADVTDYDPRCLGECLDQPAIATGAKVRFYPQAGAIEAEATFHLEARYGRQVAVIEVEAKR